MPSRAPAAIAKIFLATPAAERPERFVLVREAAAIAAVNRRTVQRWIRNGDVEAARIGGRFWVVKESLLSRLTPRQ